VLEAQSTRLSMIAEKVAKNGETAYKMIQRFLNRCDPAIPFPLIQSTDAAIDRLVYQLYNLSEEEIKIVEGK
jgi:hypothetical protein